MDEKQSYFLKKDFLKLLENVQIEEPRRFNWYSGLYIEALNDLSYAPDCATANAGLEHISAVMPLQHLYVPWLYIGVKVWGDSFKEKDWHEEPIRRIMLAVMCSETIHLLKHRRFKHLCRAFGMYQKALLALYLWRPFFPVILHFTNRWLNKKRIEM